MIIGGVILQLSFGLTFLHTSKYHVLKRTYNV